MSKDIDKLIKMANQVGDFFEANPDVELAKKEIAAHLNKFWNSIMINTIVAHVKTGAESALHPQVAEAIKQHIA